MKAEHAWGLLAAGVVAYDLLCEEGQTLSEAFRRQPLLVQVGEIAVVGSHLLNLAPQYDPIHHAHKRIRGENGHL